MLQCILEDRVVGGTNNCYIPSARSIDGPQGRENLNTPVEGRHLGLRASTRKGLGSQQGSIGLDELLLRRRPFALAIGMVGDAQGPQSKPPFVHSDLAKQNLKWQISDSLDTRMLEMYVPLNRHFQSRKKKRISAMPPSFSRFLISVIFIQFYTEKRSCAAPRCHLLISPLRRHDCRRPCCRRRPQVSYL